MKKSRSYTEEQFKEAVANSVSIRQALLALNLNPKGGGGYRSFAAAVSEFGTDTSHFLGERSNLGRTFRSRRSLEDILNNVFPIQSHQLRLRLFKEGIFEKKCYTCNHDTWNELPIPLELDHIDGNHENNNLSNLRIICPNCHAQTKNHAGKNKKGW